MRNIKNISNLIIKLNLLREDTQTTGQLSAAAAGTATDIPSVKLLTDCQLSGTENQYKNINTLTEKVNNLQKGDYTKEILQKSISDFTQELELRSSSINVSTAAVSDSEQQVSTVAGQQKLNIYSYLNILSKFNAKLANNQFNFYNFNKGSQLSNSYLFKQAIKIIELTFLSMGCLISRPIFKIIHTKNNLEKNNNNKKIIIQLFYFIKFRKEYISVPAGTGAAANATKGSVLRNSTPTVADASLQAGRVLNGQSAKSSHLLQNIYMRYPSHLQNLSDFLTNLFNCEIEFELIKLNKPYYNSHILVQHLALRSYKYRFVRLVSKLFRRMNIYYNKSKNLNCLVNLDKLNLLDFNNFNKTESFPSYLSGINIRLAGRTFKQKIIPRMTVKQIQNGVLSDVKVKFIEKARYTGKTKRGSYSFTVILGHIL